MKSMFLIITEEENKENKITLTYEDLQKIIDENYNQGYRDGQIDLIRDQNKAMRRRN